MVAVVNEDKLSAVLSEFARTLITDFPIQGILDHLVERIVEVLPVTSTGVTLISPGMAPRYIAASDESAMRFERLQTEIGQGPCLWAYESGEAVSVPDLAADHRFPTFSPAAVAAGLAAVFTFPLRHGQGRLGALDLYRDTPGELDPHDMSAAQTLADVAAAYLLNAQAREEARAASDRFHHNALHDPLTGLPNRVLLQERLEHAAERSKRSHTSAAIVFADLNGFKQVNDTHGHQVGDDLLIAIANRLAGLVRSGDTLARYSGDEFVFLCEDLHGEADADVLARRIDDAFADPFVLDGTQLTVTITASVGIAFAGPGEDITNELVVRADMAMYQAKRKGGAGRQIIDMRPVSSELDASSRTMSISPHEGRTTVLLIGDSDADGNLFEAILHETVPATFDIARAATLAEATSSLDRRTADCVVVDFGLPDAAALEIIETLAARSPAVALVALTGGEDHELGAATIEAGASDYLSKRALEGKLLVRCIRHAVVRKGLESSLADALAERKSAEEALLHQASYDLLSGLPNRLLFLDRLREALDRASRQGSIVGVIYFDIDQFKVINDSLGYPVGDQLLLVIATRLSGLVRPGDTLARIGSDEFVVLCEGLTGEADVVGVADRICAAMNEPIAWDGGALVISVGAGIAVASSGSILPDSIVSDAEAAMYRAKDEGRGRSAVFVETMRTKAIGRLDTEVELRQSIVDGDLRLHYQPIVQLADGQVIGHEALVRWDHPTRGLLRPDQFIEVAEETGLIVPLGAWVVQEACRQAKRFQTRDPRWSRLTMSVNLSGRQLGQPDLIELIASALHDADLRPEHLQLEMTEGILMDDTAATITILQMLRGLGVRLDVDDFGTGFSSLAYLKRFPVDVLKIDHSFVRDLGTDPEDAAIVAAVVHLADALGFTVIAEGVETGLQRECLVDLGCSRAQGYLFAHPVEASEAEAALDRAAGVLPDPSPARADSPQRLFADGQTIATGSRWAPAP